MATYNGCHHLPAGEDGSRFLYVISLSFRQECRREIYNDYIIIECTKRLATTKYAKFLSQALQHLVYFFETGIIARVDSTLCGLIFTPLGDVFGSHPPAASIPSDSITHASEQEL